LEGEKGEQHDREVIVKSAKVIAGGGGPEKLLLTVVNGSTCAVLRGGRTKESLRREGGQEQQALARASGKGITSIRGRMARGDWKKFLSAWKGLEKEVLLHLFQVG